MDLIERLRIYTENVSNDMVPMYVPIPECLEAADEIERLRAELAALKQQEQPKEIRVAEVGWIENGEAYWHSSIAPPDGTDLYTTPPTPQPAQVPQWQPIETAPKDGTRILLYRPLAEKTGDEPIDIKRGIPRDNECWSETVPPGMDGTNYTDGACKATHWMPLPAAPQQEVE